MTLSQFKKLYQQTESNLKSQLIIDTIKHGKGLPVRESSLESQTTYFGINEDDKVAERIAKLHQMLSKLDNPKVRVSKKDKAVLGGMVFVGTNYIISHTKLREEITTEIVKEKMKAIVQSQIRKELDNSYTYLDCKVMDLFKRGTITWEDVIKSHSTDCSL